MNDDLALDADGINFIGRWEGLRLKPYRCTANKLTVGYGHVILDKEASLYPEGREITLQEAERLLRLDAGIAERAVRRYIRRKLNQNEFNALVSFAFNVGTKWVMEGSVASAVNEGRTQDVRAALGEFNKVKAQVVNASGQIEVKKVVDKGLVNRRTAEADLFLLAPGSLLVSVASIRSIQLALIRLGYDLGSAGADGVAGARTTEAVKSFQAKAGLVADGKVGPKTAAALQAAVDAT